MFWNLIAKIVSHPPIAEWMIQRALKTPYFHLPGYMGRWWLFNGYGDDHKRRFSWLPSLRIHWILRADDDPNPHDHPCNARTFPLKGWYLENRDGVIYFRFLGRSAAIPFGMFHNIVRVSEDGVWTLFVMYRRCDSWGFLVDGKKVNYRDYYKMRKQNEKL